MSTEVLVCRYASHDDFFEQVFFVGHDGSLRFRETRAHMERHSVLHCKLHRTYL